MFKRSLAICLAVGLVLLSACASSTNHAASVPVDVGKLTLIDFYSDECPNCMVMQPIIDKLGDRYRDRLTVQALNIDTDGKSLYDSMGLQGNPIFLILQPDGKVLYKGYGRVPELALDTAIREAVDM